MNQRERVTDLFLLPILLLLGGIVALRLESDLSERLTFAESPYLAPPAAPPPPDTSGTSARTDRVSLVVVDGLRYDAMTEARMLPLRDVAARATLAAAPPTEFLPTLITALTGAPRQMHGIAADCVRVPGDLLETSDNLLGHLEQLNRPARFFATGDQPVISRVATRIPCDAGTVADRFADLSSSARAEAGIETGARAGTLDIIHIDVGTEQRTSSNRSLAARRHREAGESVVSSLESILDSVDPDRETVAVLFLDSTVSGEGIERRSKRSYPELFLHGRGIRPGPAVAGSIEDLAPTLALLLGTPFPFANSGEPLREVLASGDDDRTRLADLAAQKARFRTYCADTFVLGDAALAPGAERTIVATRARQYRAVVLPQILMGVIIALILILLEAHYVRIWTLATGVAAGGVLVLGYLGLRQVAFDPGKLTARGGYEVFAGELLIYGVVVVGVLLLGAFYSAIRQSGRRLLPPAEIAQRSLLVAFGTFLVLWGLATLSWLRIDIPASGAPEFSRWTLAYGAALLLIKTVSFGAVAGSIAGACGMLWMRRQRSTEPSYGAVTTAP